MAYNENSFFSRLMVNIEKHLAPNFFSDLFPDLLSAKVESEEVGTEAETPEEEAPVEEETTEEETPSTEEGPVDEGDQPIE